MGLTSKKKKKKVKVKNQSRQRREQNGVGGERFFKKISLLIYFSDLRKSDRRILSG